jgi:hypothetical protein
MTERVGQRGTSGFVVFTLVIVALFSAVPFGNCSAGPNNTYIATLVERQTRYVMLAKVAGKDIGPSRHIATVRNLVATVA